MILWYIIFNDLHIMYFCDAKSEIWHLFQSCVISVCKIIWINYYLIIGSHLLEITLTFHNLDLWPGIQTLFYKMYASSMCLLYVFFVSSMSLLCVFYKYTMCLLCVFYESSMSLLCVFCVSSMLHSIKFHTRTCHVSRICS